ncbi:HelD family protein [Lapillicoccus jejuensis]|uniref:DNA helicase IV n=1 Tax=Lapillicoccus jejuensis TaxID=402171 RepID=A0A542E0S9_9MICO|nr:AAA family ATPase [Lapillicoccus jejuensis]TQJ08942.1 DNA helicase IV [Lapillicoccus jejuensis]
MSTSAPPDISPDHTPDRTTDPELAHEQAHLADARRELARMRAKTLATDRAAGDAVSDAFLAGALARRAESLQDDPTSTLFFGRLDLDGSHPDAQGHETWYVGRRHVSDEVGDPLVIDWRANLSGAFYRASRTEPMGVTRRRRFGVDRGRLTAYEDEHLQDATEQDTRSAILASEIERPRVGPMRDIVATIQPEQDTIVRAGAGTTICVQGAPGTGKTAVGLHRAAWLLYAFRDKLSRSGVLVVGPNRAFLEHVGAVLPALGEVRVGHTTVEELVAERAPVRGADEPAVAVLKGDARMATVLARAVAAQVRPATEPLVVPRGAHRWRVPAYEVEQLLRELRERDIRYGAARGVLPQRLAHHVLLAMERSGDSPDDQVQDAVARTSAVKKYVETVWPALDPRQVLLGLLSDADVLARHADGVLTDEEQRMLLWHKPPRSKASARWSLADVVLLDELADLVDRTPSLGHVVLDEAQDLSPMQLRAVGRRCSTGSATVLGDIAQGTTPWATASWEESLAHLGKAGSHVEVLDRGFRVPALVIDYAARLLPVIAPGLGAPQSVRDNPGRLDVERVATEALPDAVVDTVQALAAEPGSVGVIAPESLLPALQRALDARGASYGVLGRDHGDVDHQVDLVPATVAKGLEFDRVVVVEPARIAADEPDERTGLRRLYVVLTRAVSGLTVLHSQDLPELLATAG